MSQNKKILLITLLILASNCAKMVDLPQPDRTSIQDQSQLVKLAQQQRFVIPLNGRTISHSIQYIPKNSNECQFISPQITYKSLQQYQAVFNNQDQIVNLLVLKSRQIVIVADPFYNIAAYSTDRHFLLKSKLPKTNLNKFQQIAPQKIASPVLVSTSNEQYIYYLTPTASFVFHYNNVASDIKQFKLQGDPSIINKAIQRNGYILLCSGYSGILVYQIDPLTKYLRLKQQILPKSNEDIPIDMEINQATQMLYVLNDQKTIQVYSFNSNKKNESDDKFQILKLHDEIDLQNITYNHAEASRPNQMIAHMNIQISRGRVDQTILVLFRHRGKTIVAQINYKSSKKQYSFVRYFKYSIQIKQINVIGDVMVLVGSGILGMFPYGIHPKLIVQQFNGYMTLTPIQKIAITEAPFFIGISKNNLQFAGIFPSDNAGINCHLSTSSTLKQIKFRTNLTVCGNLQQLQVTKYCEYVKTFIIKQMQLTATAPVATSLWVATIVFTLLVVLGLCCLFTIQKRKQRYIRRLQLQFQQHRRKLPASSDRAN